MIYELKDTQPVRKLFEGWRETMIWSCLDGIMGHVYTDELQQPCSAMACLGDFCFLAGKPSRELVSCRPDGCQNDYVIMAASSPDWHGLITSVYGKNARKRRRFAMKKEPDAFHTGYLRQLAGAADESVTFKMIDRKLYDVCISQTWSRDFVALFKDYETFCWLGLGVIALKNGEPVSGAASYSRYKDGIEIQVETKEPYRRQGLAAACCARLILECQKRGLYPSWDAHNSSSASLAMKLGYHLDYEYIAYEIEGYGHPAHETEKHGGLVPEKKDCGHPEAPWKVSFGGSFWKNNGPAGTELALNTSFLWGNEQWFIPSVYLCPEGLVMDLCLKARPDVLKSFIDRWDLLHEDAHSYSEEERARIGQEHPLTAEFKPWIFLDGQLQPESGRCMVSWIPKSCLDESFHPEERMQQLLKHYGLDCSMGWAVYRCSFRWPKRKLSGAPDTSPESSGDWCAGEKLSGAPDGLASLGLRMERMAQSFEGPEFFTPKTGAYVPMTHPVNGQSYLLRVLDCQVKKLEQAVKTPVYYTLLTYTVTPPLADGSFILKDVSEAKTVPVSGIGVIGGADGPAAVFIAGKNNACGPESGNASENGAAPYVACSSLYFYPPQNIRWRMLFLEKNMENLEIRQLLPMT